MRRMAMIAFLFVFFAAGGVSATTKGPKPPPQTETLDCAKDGNKDLCVECGGGGILACCWEDECDVINKPPKKHVLPPQTPIRPTLPRAQNWWQTL